MIVKQFKYDSRDDSLDRFPEDFVKSFYLRNGIDCGWEEYQKLEGESGWIFEIFDCLHELCNRYIEEWVLIYSEINDKDGKRYDISAVIQFDERGDQGDFLESVEREKLWLVFTGDSGNNFHWAGVDIDKILFAESY